MACQTGAMAPKGPRNPIIRAGYGLPPIQSGQRSYRVALPFVEVHEATYAALKKVAASHHRRVEAEIRLAVEAWIAQHEDAP